MNLFELLILALFFLLPAISRLLSKNRQRNAPQPEPEEWDEIEELPRYTQTERRQPGPAAEQRRPGYGRGPQPAEQPDSLAEALRQIREALGQPETTPAPAPKPDIPQYQQYGTPPPMSTEARSSAARPSAARPSDPRPERSFIDEPRRPLQVEVVDPKRAPGPTRLAASLRTSHGARDAFVLREILDKPPSVIKRRR
jgi:hypothetical protein